MQLRRTKFQESCIRVLLAKNWIKCFAAKNSRRAPLGALPACSPRWAARVRGRSRGVTAPAPGRGPDRRNQRLFARGTWPARRLCLQVSRRYRVVVGPVTDLQHCSIHAVGHWGQRDAPSTAREREEGRGRKRERERERSGGGRE